MVGPGGRPDDAGAPGVVLVGDAAGGAVASGRTPGGRADGLVREGVPDVLRLYPAGTATDLAEPNYRLLTFDDRCTPIATDAPGGHCPRPLVSGMRAKAELDFRTFTGVVDVSRGADAHVRRRYHGGCSSTPGSF